MKFLRVQAKLFTPTFKMPGSPARRAGPHWRFLLLRQPTGRMLNVNQMLAGWLARGAPPCVFVLVHGTYFERYLNQLCRNFQNVCQPAGRNCKRSQIRGSLALRWQRSVKSKHKYISAPAWQQKAVERKSHISAHSHTHSYTHRDTRVIRALCAYRIERPPKRIKRWEKPKTKRNQAKRSEANKTNEIRIKPWDVSGSEIGSECVHTCVCAPVCAYLWREQQKRIKL